MSPTELTWRQVLVLTAIERAEMPQTVAEIADALGAPKGHVRSCLKSLSRRGLVAVKGSALSGGQTWATTAATCEADRTARPEEEAS